MLYFFSWVCIMWTLPLLEVCNGHLKLHHNSTFLIRSIKSDGGKLRWNRTGVPLLGFSNQQIQSAMVLNRPADVFPKLKAKYVMYGTLIDQAAVFVSSSNDGVLWTTPHVVLTNRSAKKSNVDKKATARFQSKEGSSSYSNRDRDRDREAQVLGSPCVVSLGGILHMWFISATKLGRRTSSIMYANSTDGIHWSRFADSVLVTSLEYEQGIISAVNVIFDDTLSCFRMWFTAGGQMSIILGYAESTDGVTWVKRNNKPLFVLETTTEQSSLIGYVQIFKELGAHYAFYSNAHGIGLARSPDGIDNWEMSIDSPFFLGTPDAWDAIIARPWVMHNGTHLLLWYSGTASIINPQYKIGLAVQWMEPTSTSSRIDWRMFEFPGNYSAFEKFHVGNSPQIKEMLSAFPDSWRKPCMFGVVADESYLESIGIFAESILSFGYSKMDMFVVCTTVSCSNSMDEIQMPHYLIHRRACKSNSRCLIDVFFRASPLNFIPIDSVEMYVQDNNDLTSVPFNGLNFGMFLVKSTPRTIRLFEEIQLAFRETNQWDQLIFNNKTVTLNVSYVFLPNSTHVAFDPNWAHLDHTLIVAAHMVCVEGSLNKLLLARHHYGPFAHPSHYALSLITSSSSKNWEKKHQLALIGILTALARGSGRGIRIDGGTSLHKTMALFNADTLHADGFSLVEDNFWDSVKQYNATRFKQLRVTDFHVASMGDIVAFHSQYQNVSHFDDIRIIISFPFLASYPLTDELDKYLCRHFATRYYYCLQTCSGVHF